MGNKSHMKCRGEVPLEVDVDVDLRVRERAKERNRLKTFQIDD
jgi:hypothetical protein